MCTLTFIPQKHGYLLGMNRDESIHRGALPPERFEMRGVPCIFPRDIEGGTWIATNATGATFALLNRSDVETYTRKLRSRGDIVTSVAFLDSAARFRSTFENPDLSGVLPFRLIGFFPSEQEVVELAWDQKAVEANEHPWELCHWFSSGLSDQKAGELRGQASKEAQESLNTGTTAWLRKLHASHANGPGPFSICVHRENVRTLSYTEVLCGEREIECQYFAGSPCDELSIGHQTICRLERNRT